LRHGEFDGGPERSKYEGGIAIFSLGANEN
jgi:hypothetical protein